MPEPVALPLALPMTPLGPMARGLESVSPWEPAAWRSTVGPALLAQPSGLAPSGVLSCIAFLNGSLFRPWLGMPPGGAASASCASGMTVCSWFEQLGDVIDDDLGRGNAQDDDDRVDGQGGDERQDVLHPGLLEEAEVRPLLVLALAGGTRRAGAGGGSAGRRGPAPGTPRHPRRAAARQGAHRRRAGGKGGLQGHEDLLAKDGSTFRLPAVWGGGGADWKPSGGGEEWQERKPCVAERGSIRRA